jgi:hypothetical protein
MGSALGDVRRHTGETGDGAPVKGAQFWQVSQQRDGDGPAPALPKSSANSPGVMPA